MPPEDYVPEIEEFPPEPPAEYDYDPPDDGYFLSEPPEEYVDEPFLSALASDPAALSTPPDTTLSEWNWLDARFVGMENVDPSGQITGYDIGCVEVYSNTRTGNLGGAFLPIQAFKPEELEQAEDLFQRLNGYTYDQGLAAHELPAMAEKVATRIAERAGQEPPTWRGLTPDEYELYGREWGLTQASDPDMPPDRAHDDLRRTAYELGGVEAEIGANELHPAAQALTGIGLTSGDFDPDRDIPPFYDETTQTAYWIGIYQPDPDNHETCITSILSLSRDPDSGTYEALLAPCAVGDWDKAYEASEHLIGIAQRSDDIERVFEAAEGMAIAGDQRQEWQQDRGVLLEPDSAQTVGEYAAQQWELDL
jgi:hypothetical protein